MADSILVNEAAEASCLWLAREIDAASQTMERLESTLMGRDKADPKIAHNLAIADYYCKGCTNAAELIGQLDAIAAFCTAPAATAPESGPSTSAASGSTTITTTAPLRTTSFSHAAAALAANSTAVVLDPAHSSADEVAAVCALNKAQLLYHGGSYREAARLLQPIVDELEAAHDGLALHAATLLMDVYLAARQPDRAAAVLLALEKACGAGLLSSMAGDGGGSTIGPVGEGPATGSEHAVGSSGHDSSSKATGGHAAMDAQRSHMVGAGSTGASVSAASGAGASQQGVAGVSEGGRPCVTLPAVTHWGSNVMQQARTLMLQQGRGVGVPDGRAIIKLYRARLLLQRRAVLAARHEVRALAARDPGCWAAPFLRAQSEVLRGAPRKAAKLLLASLNDVVARGRGLQGPSSAALAAEGSTSSLDLHTPMTGSAAGCGATSTPATPTSRTHAAPTVTRTPASEGSRSSTNSSHLHTPGPLPRGVTSPLQGSPAVHDPQPPPELMRTSLFNDLGVAYHHMGRHHISATFFAQALAQLEERAQGTAALGGGGSLAGAAVGGAPLPGAPKGVPSSGMGSTDSSTAHVGSPSLPTGCQVPTGSWGQLPRTALLYNAGVQHLLLGNWQLARRCLRGALVGPAAAPSPLALLRLAEATLGEARTNGQEFEDARIALGSRALPHHVLLPQGNGAGGPGVRSAQDTQLPVVHHFPSTLAGSQVAAGSGAACDNSTANGNGTSAPGAPAGTAQTQQDHGAQVHDGHHHHQQQQQQQQLVDEAIAALTAALNLLEEQRAADRAAAAAAAAAEDEAAAWAAEVEVAAAVAADPVSVSDPSITSLTLRATHTSKKGGSKEGGPKDEAAGGAGSTSSTPTGSSHLAATTGVGDEPAAAAGLQGSAGEGSALRSRPGSMVIPVPALSVGAAGMGPGAGALPGVLHAASESALQLSQMARGEAAPWVAREQVTLHTALLTNLAYAHLLKGDHAAALAAAKALLALPGLTAAAQMLGACYAAEAACVLGQTQEAQQLLSSCLKFLQAEPSQPSQPHGVLPGAPYAELPSATAGAVQESVVSAPGGSLGLADQGTTSHAWPYSAEGCVGSAGDAAGPAAACKARTEPPPCLGNAGSIAAVTGAAARATLLTNLASVLASEGELEQAHGLAVRAVEEGAPGGGCRSAQLLLVWLELAAGRPDSAITLLQQQRMHPVRAT